MRQRTIPTPDWAASKSRKDLKLHMWNTAFQPLIIPGVDWGPSASWFLVAWNESQRLKLNPVANSRGNAEQNCWFMLKASSHLRIFTCQLHWGVLKFLAYWPRGSQHHNIDTGEPMKKELKHIMAQAIDQSVSNFWVASCHCHLSDDRVYTGHSQQWMSSRQKKQPDLLGRPYQLLARRNYGLTIWNKKETWQVPTVLIAQRCYRHVSWQGQMGEWWTSHLLSLWQIEAEKGPRRLRGKLSNLTQRTICLSSGKARRIYPRHRSWEHLVFAPLPDMCEVQQSWANKSTAQVAVKKRANIRKRR